MNTKTYELSDFLDLIQKKDPMISQITQKIHPTLNIDSQYYQFYTYKKNQYIIHSTNRVTKLYILLSGSCQYIQLNSSGSNSIHSDSDNLLGLFEIINQNDCYYASVVATESTTCLEISCDYFLKVMNSDINIARIVINHLSHLIELNIIRADRFLLFSNYQLLINHFRQIGYSTKYPVNLKVKREELAAILGINLRTLYRYLDKLKNENYITIKNSHIYISKSQYINICKEAENHENNIK